MLEAPRLGLVEPDSGVRPTVLLHDGFGGARGAGSGQKPVTARTKRQDEPPPGSCALGIAPAGGQSEHDGRLAVAEMAGWHGLSLACGRLPTEGYLTRSRICP